MIRLVVSADNAVLRSGLRVLLEMEEGLEVVGDAGSAHDAVLETRAHQPDVVVVDATSDGPAGIDAIPPLLAAAPATRVLMLSMDDDPTLAQRAFEAGGYGYVLTGAADAEVVAAVREVATGNRYVHPALAARVIAAGSTAQSIMDDDPLSDREREVLRLIALGHTNQEIAQQLSISVRTAETHRAHVMRKLHLTTRAELVRYAIEHGGLGPS